MNKMAIGLALLAAAMSLKAVEVDGIVATVNEESILMSEVVGEMARIGRSDPQAAALVVNELINRKLILKASRDQKMTMQDWVVENRVREIIKQSFGGDRNRLMDQLARDRVSYPEWYAHIREDMIVSAMRYQIIDKNVVATPKALREEYEAHPDLYSRRAAGSRPPSFCWRRRRRTRWPRRPSKRMPTPTRTCARRKRSCRKCAKCWKPCKRAEFLAGPR